MKSSFLARFTPSLMSAEALEAIFVQREPLAQDIVERIRDSALTKAKHHILLIGPRGIGKTHLVALVYHRIKALPEVEAALRIAWLREEEWGITSFRDLVMRVLRALQGEYGEACLEEKIEAIYKMASADEAERAAVTLLKEFVGDKTLLVLMENLDDIFQGLGNEGQQQFRAFLQNHGGTAVFATSQSLFNGVSLRTSPFYGFFNIQHLPTFSLDEAMRLLTKIAEHEQDESLVDFLQTPKGRARVRAVHHLAGGNPRVYLIFSQFLTREALDALVEPFMQMLDNLTPYYQARMAWLSPQQRKIVEFLIENRGAAPVKAIADRTFTTPQTASSQLKTLRDQGYVRSESQGRESYYELREPLMRLAIEVKKHRGQPIRLFIDFLRFWYTRDELENRLNIIDVANVIEREYVEYALRMKDEETEDPILAACKKDFYSYWEMQKWKEASYVAEELIEHRGNANDWNFLGAVLFQQMKLDEALLAFDKAIQEEAELSFSWSLRGVTLAALQRYEEALESSEKALELQPDDAHAWAGAGLVLRLKGHYAESLEALDKAIEVDEKAISDYTFIHIWRAENLFNLGYWNKGVKDLKRVFRQIDIRKIISEFRIDLVLNKLFEEENAEKLWENRIRDLYDIFNASEAEHFFDSRLAINFVRRIRGRDSTERLRMWYEAWRKVVGSKDTFQLQLLDTAIRYRETEDRRVLLELPVEERQILEQMLELEPADQPA